MRGVRSGPALAHCFGNEVVSARRFRMWNLFGQRKAMQKEVFDTLLPGDLYGGEHRSGRQPEDLVRYLMLAAVPMLTFYAIILSQVDSENAAHEDFAGAVWLLGMGIAIAVVAWVLFKLSRAGESKALGFGAEVDEPSALPPRVKAIMKRAATMKLLAFRVMIVSGISGCVGFYIGLRGLFVL